MDRESKRVLSLCIRQNVATAAQKRMQQGVLIITCVLAFLLSHVLVPPPPPPHAPQEPALGVEGGVDSRGGGEMRVVGVDQGVRPLLLLLLRERERQQLRHCAGTPRHTCK